ncbi:MAG TPA: Crp/Fnr family transcriptional regulator [Noviherbaspirillum sp.]|uniref:Crp/Fnr family transcriptional regulator n=1 Tax=Noviherbaspirillum sp. TaxID=1926288 RepID=UPI002D38F3CD|nr:Crp/Fnr family transcriptional regulator [Noviherbaspirillum sp.]HYD95448.1 Crp/Fnr family transcriptional regulator [Noviherbaspirillum sp.]
MSTDAQQAGATVLQLLPPAIRKQLEDLPVLELPANTPVFAASARCPGFPIILSGAVRVFRYLANGRRIELYRVTPDEVCILSLGCLLGDGQYPADGVTLGPTRLVVMPPALFNACLASDEHFRTAVFRSLGDRLVRTMELVEEVATLRLDVRLAKALLAHGETAVPAPDGSCVCVIPITHQELADELGTVREMISRVLDDFASQGMLKPGRGRIEICDEAKLLALAAQR